MHKRGLLSLQQPSSTSQQGSSSRLAANFGIDEQQEDSFITKEKKVRKRPPHITTTNVLLSDYSYYNTTNYEFHRNLPIISRTYVNLYDKSSQRLNHYVIHDSI